MLRDPANHGEHAEIEAVGIEEEGERHGQHAGNKREVAGGARGE